MEFNWLLSLTVVRGWIQLAMDKEEGKMYGDYTLGELIGKGTYGYVYKARQTQRKGDKTSSSSAVSVRSVVTRVCDLWRHADGLY